MYPQEFKKLVKEALKNSERFYQKSANEGKPNPYYIGYGNPKAKLLIIGKEKAIAESEIEQIKLESIQNPNHWSTMINKITSVKDVIDFEIEKNSRNYKNPFQPYQNKVSGGTTWSHYQDLVQIIIAKDLSKSKMGNSFLEEAFISEVNHLPSKQSKGNKFTIERKEAILKSKYFMQFPVIILAAGNYLKTVEIEEIFDVKHDKSASKSHKKLEVYINQNRILINTRQMSNFRFSNEKKAEYFQRIADEIRLKHPAFVST